MKKITLLLFFFLATIVANAQDMTREVGKDSINYYITTHSMFVDGMLKRGVEKKIDADMTAGYIRLKGGSIKFLNIPEKQRPSFRDLFSRQYSEITPFVNQFIKDNDQQSAKKLVTILLRQEDEFRAMIGPAQLEVYRAEFSKKRSISVDMLNNFYVSDKVYDIFKQYLR